MELGEQYGYRNAQATVLAPTGTIGFMMDCDTTGVEPDIALVKYKKLVGGGLMKIVNQTVPMALRRLGYTDAEIRDIVDYIDVNETIEGAPHLLEKHLPVFDCAFKAAKGERSIHYMGHIKMMGGTQPFISGAISKTVNVPKEASVDDITQAYMESWKLGAKAISIYRDGSKRTQPLNTSREAKVATETVQQAAVAAVAAQPKPVRRRLPDERPSDVGESDGDRGAGAAAVPACGRVCAAANDTGTYPTTCRNRSSARTAVTVAFADVGWASRQYSSMNDVICPASSCRNEASSGWGRKTRSLRACLP